MRSFKVTLEMGMKRSGSGFRCPETKVSAESGLTDVRQFVQESSLTLDVVAEMEAVADTFRGVEKRNGVFHWEGDSGNQKARIEGMHHEHIENHGHDHAYRVKLLKDSEPEWTNNSCADNWVKQGESQRKRLLSSIWKILPQKTTSTTYSVELIEFARDMDNANSCTLYAQ